MRIRFTFFFFIIIFHFYFIVTDCLNTVMSAAHADNGFVDLEVDKSSDLGGPSAWPNGIRAYLNTGEGRKKGTIITIMYDYNVIQSHSAVKFHHYLFIFFTVFSDCTCREVG